jgi:hypothetical protein
MHLSKNDLYSETGKPSSVNRTSHLTLSPKTSILFSGVGGVVPSVRSVFRLEKTAVSYLGFWLERKEPCHASGGQMAAPMPVQKMHRTPHTQDKKTAKCSGIELVSARLLPINREATHKCFS